MRLVWCIRKWGDSCRQFDIAMSNYDAMFTDTGTMNHHHVLNNKQ